MATQLKQDHVMAHGFAQTSLCPFVGTSHEHQPNKVNWRVDPIHKGVQICKICDTYAVREGCGARKLVEFDPKSQLAIVYHLGKHTWRN